MINVQNKTKSECCGCTACAAICSHEAISMIPDDMGFKYPVVDTGKCTNCGLCIKICAFNRNYKKTDNFSKPKSFGARHRNAEELMTSRSGGVFVALYDWVLKQGGVVYGAGFSGHFRVIHKRASTKEQCREFKGSKYVQSDLDGIFLSVRKDLEQGLIVLFSGTPCQTAGLQSYIGKRFEEKLFLVDIICHGVPSPYIWEDYLSYLEEKENKKITAVNFRDKKRFGWTSHKESFLFNNTYTYTYTYIFYKHIMFRQSCSECPYCNLNRPSDLTLGDFWGWEKTDPLFNLDDKGCSLVLCNTPKGLNLFEAVRAALDVRPAKLEDCMQTHLSKPSSKHPLRIKFEEEYVKLGFEYVLKKYCTETPAEYLRRKAGVAKRVFVRFIKTVRYKLK